MTSAAPHTYTSTRPVEEPAELPERIAGRPALVATQGADDLEDAPRRGVDATTVLLEQHALMGRQLTALRLARAEAGKTRCPGGFDVIGGQSCHGPLHSL